MIQKGLYLFDTDSQYETARSSSYEEPWISYTKANGEVHYNKSIRSNGHEYIDLGLPSGVLWSPCNLGASSPEECGDYYAGGEIEPKTTFTLQNYRFYNSSSIHRTKYNPTDNIRTLELEDDAAYMNGGGTGRMPTLIQFRELKNNCTFAQDTENGVSGVRVTGPNNNTLFFPYNTTDAYVFQISGQITSVNEHNVEYIIKNGNSGYAPAEVRMGDYEGRGIRPVLISI